MALNDFTAYGKPHSGSVIFAAAMQSLERLENKFGKLRVKPDAVVFYKNLTYPLSVQLAINLDVRGLAATEFQSVTNQILEEPLTSDFHQPQWQACFQFRFGNLFL